MREVVDADRIHRFMTALASEQGAEARLYFTGGVTAVLYGWRTATIDVDIKLIPEDDRLLRAIPRLKESLQMNVELASPGDFIPEPPRWEDRSPFIAREGRLSFHHYDLYAQALAKIERGHLRDMEDVREMIRRGLVEPGELLRHFASIEPFLFRYPAVDPRSFRRAVEETVRKASCAGEKG